MQTECNAGVMQFEESHGRSVEGRFDAVQTSSDGGILLLREVANGMKLFERVAGCFTDHRNPKYVTHALSSLISQRVLGIACGYEDLVDHEALRHDVLFSLCAGKRNVVKTEHNQALAGKSTLNRLELTPKNANATARYKKISYDEQTFEGLFVALFLDAHAEAPKRIVLDLDATDDPLHGSQEGRFFHGYYGGYCYLPLYIFCGDHLLVAKLREADQDGAAGAVEEVTRLVTQIRARWPKVEIVLRADSGFAREELMAYCEKSRVHYVFGLARNARLTASIESALERVRAEYERTSQPARCFEELRYSTLKTWSCTRRVVAKAERIHGKDNPRFVVTSLPICDMDGRALYEDFYCARGDMENRIKEQQLGLYADRTSAHTMRANQLRLWLSSLAYVLMSELRRTALAKTEFAKAQMSTIRTKLLKIAAVVTVSVRRIRIAFSSVFPYRDVFMRIVQALATQSAA
jgi:Transposase DDE domain group 1